MRGSYNTRSKPWFRLTSLSENMHRFFALLRRKKVIY